MGNNIDQLLAKANSAGFIDVPLLKRSLEETQKVEEKIVEAYSMKEK